LHASNSHPPQDEARKDALQRNTDYSSYIQVLKNAGYFQGEREDSANWKQLEDKAVEAFIKTCRDDDATRSSFASEVDAVMSIAGGVFVCTKDEDSDAWLNIDASDFDAMLEKNLSQAPSKPDEASGTEEDRVEKEQVSRLHNLAMKVEEFVEGQGDIEGARFHDEEFSEGELSDDDDDTGSSSEMEDVDMVDESPEAEDAQRKAAMEKLVPAIDPSEYGKMPPSFHSNSQRVARTTVETDVTEESERPEAGGQRISVPMMRPIRPPIIPRDEYEGVDSDDESEEEIQDDESEDDKPQVVGEIEIDMEEEQEEFLEFARQALGVSDTQWDEIVKDRQSRGAFVPVMTAKAPQARSQDEKEASQDKPGAAAPQPEQRDPMGGPRPDVNPKLDSFEAVMHAMDAELARSRQTRDKAAASKDGKGKGKARAVEVDNGGDIESAMDAELKAALDGGDSQDEDDVLGEEQLDYNLIKNFLESFKSQNGLSGPVGNLFGRLQPGWTLPRDEV